MNSNYEKIKKNRSLRRFVTYVVVYCSLWLAFRTLIEVFRGGDVASTFSEILFTGLIFGFLMGIYSIFKKYTLYINGDSKSNAIKVLIDLKFKEPKVYKGGKMLFIRESTQRFGGHDEVFMTKIGDLIEIECEKNMKTILNEKFVELGIM
jgi:hypothetical protein